MLLWRSRGTEGFQRTKSPRVWLQILSAWATFLFKVHILPKHERSFPAPDLRRFEEERRGRKQLVTSPTSRSPCTRNSVTLTRKLHCRPHETGELHVLPPPVLCLTNSPSPLVTFWSVSHGGEPVPCAPLATTCTAPARFPPATVASHGLASCTFARAKAHHWRHSLAHACLFAAVAAT